MILVTLNNINININIIDSITIKVTFVIAQIDYTSNTASNINQNDEGNTNSSNIIENNMDNVNNILRMSIIPILTNDQYT